MMSDVPQGSISGPELFNFISRDIEGLSKLSASTKFVVQLTL